MSSERSKDPFQTERDFGPGAVNNGAHIITKAYRAIFDITKERNPIADSSPSQYQQQES